MGSTPQAVQASKGNESPVEQAALQKPWRGRIMLVLGIILLGITLRHAVTGLSPLLPVVREELGMGVGAASFLGMLPTLAFGIAGFLTPVIMRTRGPELTALLAMMLAALVPWPACSATASRCSWSSA